MSGASLLGVASGAALVPLDSPDRLCDNVGIVLKPMTPYTFGDLVGTRSRG